MLNFLETLPPTSLFYFLPSLPIPQAENREISSDRLLYLSRIEITAPHPWLLMIFTELVLQNFGPYAGRQVINLRPEKDNNPCPIILLGGMNGGGKTTLMDAIRLALYGARAKCSTRNNLSYAEFLSQAVNNQASLIDQARIELAFEHLVNEQWRQYRIVRYWTKQPKDGKDTLGILDEDWPDPALANTWTFPHIYIYYNSQNPYPSMDIALNISWCTHVICNIS